MPLSYAATDNYPNTCPTSLQGTGDLGVIIERAQGSVLIIKRTSSQVLCRVHGLGDLSHASVVFSPDARYAFVFGRDGGLTKIDLLTGSIVKRIIQAGNSIGGAISQDGHWIAVSNYQPGGIKVFDSKTLDLYADIPAVYMDSKGQQQLSKVVGLVDGIDNQFIFSLFDAGEIWQVTMQTSPLTIKKYKNIGKQPYDALISSDGRYYIAGLFGEDGLALLDLWHTEKGVQRLLSHYGKGRKKLPVYKMPHLEGWAITEQYAFLPAVGQYALLVADHHNWQEIKEIPLHGQPVFAMARPDGRYVLINFSFPRNNTLQIVDTQNLQVIHTITLGTGILHMEFSPKGEQVWISVRDDDVVRIYNTQNWTEITHITAQKPSGIFFTSRAHHIGL